VLGSAMFGLFLTLAAIFVVAKVLRILMLPFEVLAWLIKSAIGFCIAVGIAFVLCTGGFRKERNLSVLNVSGEVVKRKELGDQPAPDRVLRVVPPEGTFQERLEASKRWAVARYPELGVEGTAVNREYLRRYKLYRAVNPAFFETPDWPLQLADMLARDIGLDARP